MDALGSRDDFPFEILAFTSVDRLHRAIEEKPVQILLIAQSAFCAGMEAWVPQIILLREDETGYREGMPEVSKYSSVTRIMKKVMEAALNEGSLRAFVQTEPQSRGIRFLYTGRAMPADHVCTDDGTAFGAAEKGSVSEF